MRTLLVLVALAVHGCAPLPPQRVSAPVSERSGVSVQYRPSPNFDQRRPGYVVLHHTTDNSAAEALRTLTDPARGVSSHYLVGRDGTIFHIVDDRQRSWHAGESYWAGQRDMNSASIGIELDNNGREPFAEPMIVSLLTLLADLKARYAIPAANFIGHSDVAPGRKVDPSRFFPWKRLAAEGYGLWCDPPYPAVPGGIDTALLLHAFGYSVRNPDAAMASFKLHFSADDPSPQMTEKDRSVLYCLVLQKQASTAQ